MALIEFHTVAEELPRIAHPYPASQSVPDWFKNMPTDFEEHPTVKRCPPFLAAMGTGYIIPAPLDTRLKMTGEGGFTEFGGARIFSGHFSKQYPGAPFAGNRVLKFRNPWIIVTPPEYACLITAPINRFELPFVPLTGIVETGTYYKEVHLPMVCLLQPGQSFELHRGAPMIQVIPIRREEWTSRMAAMDDALNLKQQAMFDANPHTYKEEFWKKLRFT